MSNLGRTMATGQTPSKSASPRESGFSVGQELQQNPLESMIPGLVQHDEFPPEPTLWGEHNTPHSTSNFAEQAQTLAEIAPQEALEQAGFALPSKQRAGTIFSSKDRKKELGLEKLYQENPSIRPKNETAEKAPHSQNIPQAVERSTRLKLTREAHLQRKAQELDANRLKLQQMIKSEPALVSSGTQTLAHHEIKTDDKSIRQVLKVAIAEFMLKRRRKKELTAYTIQNKRNAAKKGSMAMEGGKDRSSSVDQLKHAEAMSGHEWSAKLNE